MSERNTDPIRVAPGSMTIEPLFPAPQAPRPPQPSPEQLAQVEEAKRRDQDLQRWHAEQEAKAPGRFSLVDEREVTARQEDWRKRNAATGVGGDIWRGLQIGADKIPRAVREVVRALPAIGPGIVAGVDQIDRWATGRDSETLFEEKEQRLRAGQTPAQQAASGKQWVEETVNPDGSVSYSMGSAWTDPRSYLGAVVESLPGTVITMVPAAALARGAYVGAMARGLGERAAAAAAARTAMIAGGVGEGVLAGGETSAEVREAIAKMPEETLRQSQAYRTLLESGKTPEQARAAIADDRAVKGMLIAGVATGLFGGMGDRALAKIVAEGVQGGITRRTVAGAARGLVAEGVFEELPQSVAEQMAKNYALQGANPNQRLMEGVPNAAAGGLVVGGLMGAGIGGAAGAARPGGVLPAPASEAEAKGQAIATGAVEGPTGPISAALDYGSRQGGATTAPDGAPPVGTEVAIRMARGQTLPGRIEGYSPTGEPMVRAEITDPDTGEITTQTLEVPLSQLAPVRPAVPPEPVVASDPEVMPQGIESQVDPSAVAAAEVAPVSAPGDPRARTERPYTDTIAPDEVTAEAAEPAGRIVPTETSELPDRKDTVPLLERPFNARPGARVIVDDPGTVGRFGATIQAISDDGQSALVRGDNGVELEMPSDRLRVSGLSARQVEARELAANPPVERETITGTVPTAREVRGKQMVMPDELHARLYDFGKMRYDSKRTLGRGALDLDTDRPAAEAVQLAAQFDVSPQRLAQIAEDYRYRVERAAKETASRTPVRMPPVKASTLQRMKAEDRREAAKRPADPPVVGGYTTERGSTYEVHQDGTTTRTKASRQDPGHEGDSGRKRRTERTIYLDTNAGGLSAAGLQGLGSKGARVAIRDNTATLLTWNDAAGQWGTWPEASNAAFTTEPAVGLYPLELWDRADDVPGYEAYKRMHAGNRIVSMAEGNQPETQAAPDVAPDTAPVEDQATAVDSPAPAVDMPAAQVAATASPVDAAANEAATSPTNDTPEPTQAQKEAGNYKLGHIRLAGLDISIENPAGSQRKGVDRDGKAWSVTMKSHYGYIKGTRGRDKDHIDVFVRPGVENLADNAPVFVVDQISPDTGRFDEHKIMLGWDTVGQAQTAYRANYAKGWKGMGAVTQTDIAELKEWLGSGDTDKPFANGIRGGSAPDAAMAAAVRDAQETAAGRLPVEDARAREREERIRRAEPEGLQLVSGEPRPAPTRASVTAASKAGTLGNAVDENSLRTLLRRDGGAITPEGIEVLVWPDERVVITRDRDSGELIARKQFRDPNTPLKTLIEEASRLANMRSQMPAPRRQSTTERAAELTATIGTTGTPSAGRPPRDLIATDNPIARIGFALTLVNDGMIRSREMLDFLKAEGLAKGNARAWKGGQGLQLTDLGQKARDAWKGYRTAPENQGQLLQDLAAKWSGETPPPASSAAPAPAARWGNPEPVTLTPARGGLAPQARDIVVSRGKATGIEHLIGINADGSVVMLGTGTDRNSGWSPEADAMVLDPAGRVVIHHNHPSSRSLSITDVSMLASPGLESVYAHGHDGSSYRAELTGPARAHLSAMDPNRGKMLLRGVVTLLDRALYEHHHPKIRSKEDAEKASAGHAHAINTILHRAGLIEYGAAGISAAATEHLNSTPADLIEREAADARRNFFAGSDVQAGRRDDRPADTVRHPGDMGIALEAAQDVRADAGGARPDETGRTNDRAEAPRVETPATPPAPAALPDFSGNKLFTADKVEAARARLRAKMRQVNSGIDPETLVDGMTIAGAYIEAGVRSFSDYARRMVEDLGPNVRPYLLSFWEGSRHYPGLDTTGMTSAAESAAQHQEMMNAPVDTEATTTEETTSGEPGQLDAAGESPLARAPAGPVRRPAEERQAERGAEGSGRADLQRDEPAGRGRNEAGRSVPDGEGTVPVPAAGAEARDDRPGPGRADGVVPRGDDDAAAGSGRGRDRQGYEAGLAPTPSAPQPAGGLVAADRPTDYTITDADELGSGGAKAKYRGNVAAIRLLRKLDAEARPATRDEQSVLAKWVGWGGLRVAFPREDGSTAKGWEKEAAELKELLTAEEYRAAESSTRNAHYTAPEIVKAMWSAVDHLGFKGGQILEPSVGAGNFLGLAPAAVRKTARFTGAELDRVTGMIAKNLYLDANIQAPVGYQDLRVPDGYFDLAIGNPPFGSERLHDRLNPEISRFSIHNYFFAKSVNGLRPGGVLAMVVTSRFLDGADRRARSYIADRADLIGAIRLPNDAFLRNANTSVTTDIVFLQRREEGVFAADMSWVDVGTFTDKEGRTVPLNRYFIGRPDMMLGEFGAYGTMYGSNELETALISREGDNLPQLVRAAIQTLPPKIMPAPTPIVATETIRVPQNVRDALEGSMFLDPDGQIWKRDPDRLGEPRASLAEIPGDTGRARVAQMIRVRDAFARLRAAQLDPKSTDEKIDSLRARLNTVYDAHVAKFGPINADANKRVFRQDPTWPQISALEDGFDKGISPTLAKKTGEASREPSAKKTAIFSKRTQQPYAPPTSASSAKDALAAVLSEYGRVDMRAMEQIYGRSEADIVTELGALIFRTPAGTYETADAYLSGNVKQKLAEAQRAAVQDPAFRANVAALQDVQPADIEAVDIDVKSGAPWVPAEHAIGFINHIIDGTGSKAFYSPLIAKWVITPGRASQASMTRWSTDDASINRVLDAAMNHTRITISEKTPDGRTVIDMAATDAANEKVEQVKTEWRRWIWEDDARRDQLARIYNDTFNTDVDPRLDGTHLKLPGKVGDDIIALRPHQLNAVWRVLQNGIALFDHTVGAGKTFAGIASIMELRRTGRAKKPVVAVPNHLVGQWAADFVKLYPGARILAPTESDFDLQNRQKLFARIATSEWDAIIIAHSSFKKIGVSARYQEAYIREQIEQILASEQALKAATGEKSRNVSQLSKQRDQLEERLEKLMDGGGKDVGLVWDDLGIDALMVDEAHEFKNLGFATSMQRVAGLGNPGGSQKAADLAIKIRHLLDTTGGRNLIFLTGTPISNSMAEMFTVQRYLAGKRLNEMGLAHFDAWARVFGEVVSDWELSPTGQYKLNSRFARFTNVPELMQLYRSFADVIVNDDIKAMLAAQGKRFPLPKVKGGRPTNIVVERSPDQAAYIGIGTENDSGQMTFPHGSLIWRAENLPKGPPQKGADNMLKVMSDARKAALDMRLIDNGYGDIANSKVHRAADEMVRIYRQWERDKGTQLVFIDLSTPQAAKEKEGARIRELIAKAEKGDEDAQNALDNMSPDELSALDGKFSVYDDLRQKLIDRGIPGDEIAFIHSANTDLQKQELFGKVRSGRVRFLFGSTPKMGAGTNVQDRMVGLHHLDAPWRPSDLEQRDGRGIRQGNKLYEADPDGFEIEILRYATKNTLDARQWQTIEAKARFIEQLRKGSVKSRTVEDIGGEASNAAEMKAAASGNPLILEEMTLRQQIRKLESAAVEHDRNQHRVKGTIGGVRREINHIETTLPDMERDAATAAETLAGDFTATIRGAAIEKPSDMGAALIAAAKEMLESGAERSPVGSYGPFKLTLQWRHTRVMSLFMAGALSHEINVGDVTEADPNGLGLKVTNTARWMVKQPEQMTARLADLRKEIPKLESQIGPFAQAAEFTETKARHNDVLTALRPKPKPPAPKAEDAPKDSVRDGEPVATIDGTELGIAFRGPDDMPALRRAALAYFNDNLRGTTALMSDGTQVMFNRRGGGKITSNSKGDMLLRMVPAIRAIIEQGRVVRREPGTKAGVIERVIVAAPVNFDGAVQNMAVSVHRHSDGQWQYDFTMDRDERAGGPAVDAGGLATREGPVPGLEVLSPRRASDPGSGTRLTPDDDVGGSAEGAADRDSVSADTSNLNLFVYNEAPAGAADADIARVRAVIDRSALAPMVRKMMAAGRLDIVSQAYGGAADGVQAFTAPDGRIQLVAPMLADADVLPVLLHEAFHAGARRLIGDAAWNGLTSRLDRLHRQFERSPGGARTFYEAARRRVGNAGITGTLTAEEFGAYAIEHYEAAPRALRGWVDDMLGRVKAWALVAFGRQIGTVTPAQLRALAVAALRDQARGVDQNPINSADQNPIKTSTRREVRARGIPATAVSLATLRNDQPLKAHPDYQAAKAGDAAAAVRAVQTLVRDSDLAAAQKAFGAGAVYVPVMAVEASGNNKLPHALAALYATRTNGTVADGMFQNNRAFHTGASAMERIANRARFVGDVVPGSRYVLVDDVTVMGSTLADLADHIQRGGGQVSGVVTLVNASRGEVLSASAPAVRDIEKRFGNAVEDLFGIAPASLTAPEAAYLRNFRDADALRARAAAAGVERSNRLRAKGVLGQAADAGPSRQVSDPTKPRDSIRDRAADVVSSAGAMLDRRSIVEKVRGIGTDIQPAMLATVPLNYFSELKRPGMTSVEAYLRTKRDMDTYRANRHETMVTIAETWRKFAGANRAGAETLSQLMNEATLASFDPSVAQPDPANGAQVAIAKLWNDLPPSAQKLYRDVRDAFVEQQTELDAVILANVDKAQLVAQRKVEQAYRSNLEKIRRNPDLTEAEKRERIEKLEGQRENDLLRGQWAHKARMTRLRQQFESKRLPAPYFPLTRFGRYLVTIRNGEGDVVSFSRFEREAERRRWVRENWSKIQQDYSGAVKEEGVIDQAADLGRAMDPRVIGEIDILLGDAGVEPNVMDAIWQRYLQTMPDLSIRKRFIHRKGTSGFQADALKGFASHMFHAAHQMARLKYAGDLTEALNGAADEARKSDDPTRATTLVNEMRKRHGFILNPTGSRAVQAVTSAMFAWYLAATPAAAIVNLTQTPMLGIPIIGARFGGMAKAAAAMSKAATETANSSGSIQNSTSLSREEQAAVRSFYESGLIERTQSHDLAGLGETGVEYSPLRHQIMSKIGWMFHRAEIWNREVTALTAYRMARDNGLTHREAIDTAHDLTWKVHFDYSNTNRARILQGDFAKILTVFQNFQLNMWYRLFRDMHQSFKGETPQARKEARHQLGGIIGMMGLLGGVTGIAGYNVIMAVAGMFFGDEEDPFGFKHQVERSILDLLGPTLGGVVLKGGIGQMTGIDLTSRIGMPDFFLREPNGNKEGAAWWQQMLFNAAGVVPSTAVNMIRGFTMVGEGKTMRGIETIAPKAIRDLMKAYRYSNEGVQSLRGDEVVPVDRISGWDVIAQASGFTPAHIAESFERNSRIRDAQTKVQRERRDLLNQFGLASKMNDTETRDAVLERIRAWNTRAYTAGFAITSDTLRQSLATRQRNAVRREDGVLISNRTLNRTLRDGLGPRMNQ